MKRICVSKRYYILAILLTCIIAGTHLWADPVPTTIDDFFLPGSQPNQSGNFQTPGQCDNCHGGYNQAVEPAFNWRGGMMSQAARDPLFYANLAIANQDAPESGDLCIRCHSPVGWLEGRSTPTNGSSLTASDREGVQCHFCHRMVKPSPLGVNPYPEDSIYTADTYPEDQLYLANIVPIPGWTADGMYVVDSQDARRGPYSDAEATHQMLYSPFHFHADLCGTCHDVSNPAFNLDSSGAYVPNEFGQPAQNFDLYSLFPVERTFSEWSVSEYNTVQGVYAPQFGGNKDYVSTCQDCHLRDVTGKGCNKNWANVRTDLPLHDMTGGNTFIPNLIEAVFPGESDPDALAAGIERATYMLQNAATLELNVEPQGEEYLAEVLVTNQTGHKLPSGYPEGRRIWINIKVYDTVGNLIYESGAYDSTTGILTEDPDIKVYEIKPGISTALSTIVNLPAGPSFHFVLNDTIYHDNRIPPRGFTNANFEAIQSPPVGYTYEDGHYWDETEYLIPANSAQVEVTLYYQTTSKEYVEFLRDENVTDDWGDTLYNLWLNNGMSPPVAMATESYTIATPPGQWITLTPTGTTTFPPSGGILEYDVAVGNDDSTAATMDIWVDVTVPGMPQPYGPILGPIQDFLMPPGFSITRDRTLSIPGGAPAGTYTLNGYLGEYNPPNNVIQAEDHFDFDKTGSLRSGQGTNGWFVDSGEPFTSPTEISCTSETACRIQIHPNPFNPVSTLSLTLPEASRVRLEIYDVSGRLVATLINGWREAGSHAVSFDGSGLASGVYIFMLETGNTRMSGKMLLLK